MQNIYKIINSVVVCSRCDILKRRIKKKVLVKNLITYSIYVFIFTVLFFAVQTLEEQMLH